MMKTDMMKTTKGFAFGVDSRPAVVAVTLTGER
jgi:hypothetical protein